MQPALSKNLSLAFHAMLLTQLFIHPFAHILPLRVRDVSLVVLSIHHLFTFGHNRSFPSPSLSLPKHNHAKVTKSVTVHTILP